MGRNLAFLDESVRDAMTSASIKAVYELLRERNAPLNVQLLVDNLQTKKIKKSQVEKSLDSLVGDGKVTRKEFGKSKIYFLSQASLEKATNDELASLKSKADSLKGKIEGEKESISLIKKELSRLRTELTDEELKERSATYEKSIAEMKEKLKVFEKKSGTVSKSSFTETKLHLQQNLVLWKKYKKMFNELWNTMVDSMESVKESKLRDEAGIETDESAGISYSTFNDMVKKRKLSPL